MSPGICSLDVRAVLVRLHRYAGLGIAIFVTVAALTGSLIAFNEELDSWLNPDLYRAVQAGHALDTDALDADTIVRRVEQASSGARVSYVSLSLGAGKSVRLRVEPRGSTPLNYDEVFADPLTGEVLGKRQWGACCFSQR